MSGTRPAEHRGRDLDHPAEVEQFVTRFYREIAQEARFHRYFGQLAAVDWSVHTRVLTAYWCGLILGGAHEPAAAVIDAHRWLHDAEPFDRSLFELWLEILDTTLDGGWAGPMAERARRRGRGMAWAMAARLGVATPAVAGAPALSAG